MASLLIRLQNALQGRYTVEHELGRGGMATVFLGHDQRLERRVAIKVYEREGGGLISAGERFLREIRIAAKLQHPNILPVHDSGEGESLVYYVMPYVAGGSVRERLEREGPFPIADAVRIAREVAEALDHAHRAGIVHRDIKPDNIMLADGVAVVADFGIAKALEQGGGKVTDTGLAIGTPAYMSPEQAGAEPLIDGRSDQYALGCVLYEMLCGTPPFTGPTSQAIMARHAVDGVPALTTLRAVPRPLEQAITRALAKAPADRWPTAREFAAALSDSVSAEALVRPPSRRVAWIGAATLVVVTAGVLLLRNGGSAVSASERADIRSIGLLPFSFDGDSTYSGIADGLSDGVSTGLVQVAGLGIKSGGRVERYRNRDDDPQTVGRELDVGTVLSAKVRFAANHFRVTARLTDVSTGRLLWQREFNGELVIAGQLQDLWSIQDSLTASIVGALRPELNTAALPRGIRTRDPTSYQLWLKARKLPPTRTGTDSAIALLRQALRRDSTYADAWAELAAWHFWQYTASYAPAAEVALSWRQAIERAFDSDPRNGPALGSRGQLRILYDWDIEGGLSDLRRAVELNPSWTDLTFTYAIYLALAAQHDSALVYARRAVALDTTSAFAWNILGKVFALAGQRDSAIRASEKSLALDSTLYHTNWVLMNSYLDAGRRSDADRAAALMLRHAEDRPEALSFAATYYRRSGNRIEAREMLNRLTARSRREYVQPAALGAVKLAVGDSSGALDALEQAARERDLHLIDNLVLNYGPLRDEPRFLAIRRRVFRDKLPADFPFP